MIPRRSIIAACAACALLALGARALDRPPGLDAAGRRMDAAPTDWTAAGADTFGAPCGACPDPAVALFFGLAFRGPELWMVANDGTLFRTRNCQVLETVSIQGFRGFATDLAWDARRDRFAVTDPELDEILIVNARGDVLATWPSPGSGPIGAAYDSTRDVVWVADWEENVMRALDAATGETRETFTVPAGTRITGLGYDPARDALYYNGRTQRTCYAVSASHHGLLGSFRIPNAGFENGEGIAVASDGRVYLHHFEARRVYCFEPVDVATPARRATWGELKRRYLR